MKEKGTGIDWRKYDSALEAVTGFFDRILKSLIQSHGERKWISVEDRLPVAGEPVWIMTEANMWKRTSSAPTIPSSKKRNNQLVRRESGMMEGSR